MPHTNYEPSDTLLGQKIQEHMDNSEPKMEIRDLADKVGSTYEYIRRIVRGMSLPSKYMLRSLCSALAIPIAEAEQLVAADRIRKENGQAALALTGLNPEIEPINKVWTWLTPEQKNMLTAQAKSLASQNRKHRAM
jgi:transcriptional regulator with XRE-family HTH domain